MLPNHEAAMGGSMNTGCTWEVTARAAGTTPEPWREMGIESNHDGTDDKVTGQKSRKIQRTASAASPMISSAASISSMLVA